MLSAVLALCAVAAAPAVCAHRLPGPQTRPSLPMNSGDPDATSARQHLTMSLMPSIGPKFDATIPRAPAAFAPAEPRARLGQFFLLIFFSLALVVIVEYAIKARSVRKRSCERPNL